MKDDTIGDTQNSTIINTTNNIILNDYTASEKFKDDIVGNSQEFTTLMSNSSSVILSTTMSNCTMTTSDSTDINEIIDMDKLKDKHEDVDNKENHTIRQHGGD